MTVANAARSDLASGGRFTRWRMTSVTTVMRCQVRRNRHRDAAVCRRMATATALWRACRSFKVLRVIELDVEAFVEACRKWFQRRIAALRVRVTDHAHRNRRRRELSAMAVGACFVTWEARCGRVVSAFVTGVAGEGTVFLTGVQKLRVIGLGALCRCRRVKSKRNKTYTDETDVVTHLRFIGGRSAIR